MKKLFFVAVVVTVVLLGGLMACIVPTPTVSPLPTPTYPPSPLVTMDRGEIESPEITINGGEPMLDFWNAVVEFF